MNNLNLLYKQANQDEEDIEILYQILNLELRTGANSILSLLQIIKQRLKTSKDKEAYIDILTQISKKILGDDYMIKKISFRYKVILGVDGQSKNAIYLKDKIVTWDDKKQSIWESAIFPEKK